jgi:hypothetical protein
MTYSATSSTLVVADGQDHLDHAGQAPGSTRSPPAIISPRDRAKASDPLFGLLIAAQRNVRHTPQLFATFRAPNIIPRLPLPARTPSGRPEPCWVVRRCDDTRLAACNGDDRPRPCAPSHLPPSRDRVTHQHSLTRSATHPSPAACRAPAQLAQARQGRRNIDLLPGSPVST